MTSPANATDSYNHSLGVIAEKTGGSEWKMLVDISEREYKAISSALIAIARLYPPFHFGLVESNYEELQARHQFVTIVLSLGRQFADPNRRTQLGESLSTSVVNWLTAMRLFPDHEETALKRRFGKESPQVKAFEAATTQPSTRATPAIGLHTNSSTMCSTADLHSPIWMSFGPTGATHEQSSRFDNR